MPYIAGVAAIDMPYKVRQDNIKEFARNLFAESFPDIDRLLTAFGNTDIDERNFCAPIEYSAIDRSFKEKNDKSNELALKHSVNAAQQCCENAGISKDEITDFIYVSSTALSTPSIDALMINEMKLNVNTTRTPLFGLGCAGGVSGLAKANTIAKANPNAVVLLSACELCSLTFIRNDLSKSNFIAASLFSDGAAAILVTGDKVKIKNPSVQLLNSRSRIYYDSLDVMGWEFLDEGFKVVFSRDIPTIVKDTVKEDIVSFLKDERMSLIDVKNFVIHPGGTKVINAYIDALGIDALCLKNTKNVLRRFGNMSSVTAIYVLNEFITKGYEPGIGLMMSLGPGFSSEMQLLKFN